MRFDMHMHSNYSGDSNLDIKAIIETAARKKLDGISITDHNSFKGSQEAIKLGGQDIIIIPGAEYSTDMGHMLVYFLKEGLETLNLKKDKLGRYRAYDIIECAHEQSAVVFAAHPFKKSDKAEKILEMADGIEAYNGRAAKWKNPMANINAMEHALKLSKPISAGSDAHVLKEIGNAFVDISTNSRNLEDIKEALLNSSNTIYGKTSSSIYKAQSQLIKCKKSKGNYLKPLLKLTYFMYREAMIKLGLNKKPLEGIYLLKDERIERHDFDEDCP